MTKPYYTLVAWDKLNAAWVDLWGSYVRAEVVQEKADTNDASLSHLTIIKTDDTAQAMMTARDALPVPAKYRK